MMPALNFQKQFAHIVESGEKRQTIRKMRKIPFRVNDTLQLYSGMRTKECRKIGESKAHTVSKIVIKKYYDICLDGIFLTMDEIDDLSKKDGFETHRDFLNFFKNIHRLPFIGQLIKW